VTSALTVIKRGRIYERADYLTRINRWAGYVL